MFGKKKNNIPKKYILVIIIILIIILLVIFSVTLKEDRKLNKVESLFKDGFTYIENIITYPFNYVSDNIKSYKKLNDVE